MPCATRAATYFVDSQTGDDAHPGTEAAKPWKTLERVSRHTMKPGDRLLFRGGREWKGTLRVRGMGTRKQRIFVGRYGKGRPPGIDGNGGRAAVIIENPCCLTMQQLAITNPGQGGKTLRSGIEVHWLPDWKWTAPKVPKDRQPPKPGSIVLRHLLVHNVNGVVTRGTNPSFYSNAGILLSNQSAVDLEDIRVEHCRLIDIRGVGCRFRCSGIKGRGGAKGPRAMIHRIRFVNNTIRRTGADGLTVTHGRDVFVAGNRCYDIGALGNADTDAIAGIWVGWHCHNSLFQHNEVARTRCWRKDGNAFDVDNECTGTHVFQYNTTHGNGGGVLMVMPSARGRVVYRYNVSINDFKAPHPQGKPAFWLAGSGPALIYNNTFIMNNGSPLTVSDNPRVRVMNNIFHFKNVKCAHPAKPTFRRNCFVGEQGVKDPGKITADPMFADQVKAQDGMNGHTACRLRDESPCRDAGVVVPDAAGHGHYLGKPDIGAVEVTANAQREWQQWRFSDLVFTGDPGKRPPIEVELSTTFTGPGKTTLAVPGFWDGGNEWRIRFTPTLPGRWSYVTTCKDVPGMDGNKGAFTAKPAAGGNPFYKHGGILRVSEDKRYLTYSDGTPFFWLGDTSWFTPSTRTPIDSSSEPQHASMFKAVVHRRKQQGYTVLHIAFLGQKKEGLWDARPSTWLPRQMTYWRRADQYMACMNEAGILPVIGMGWGPSLARQTEKERCVLWRYVVARYAALPVTWLVCGEYNQFNNPESIKAMLPLGQYVKDLDPYKRAMTIHAWYYRKEGRQAWSQPWYDFIMIQGGHKCWPETSHYLRGWNYKPRKPVLESECNYEGIHGMGPETIRWAAYRAIQSGSFGYTYGSHGLWNAAPVPQPGTWGPPTRWGKAIDRPGGVQMGYLRQCYESVPWWKLEPRPKAVSPGGGKSIHTKALGDRLFLVYFDRGLDPGRKAILKGGNPDRTYEATWFNPRTGKSTAVEGPITMPKQEWTLPNRPDKEDWMLIVDGEDGR